MSKLSLLPAALVLALGMIVSVLLLGNIQKELRFTDRTVTSKGLVERDVIADLGVWNLNTSAGGDDLTTTQAQMEKNVEAIRQFLLVKGFKAEEIALSPVRVLDRMASQYGEQRQGQTRYVISGGIDLRSNNVENVVTVSRLTNELVRSGITFSSQEGGCNAPTFLFTKLNEIKPEMLVEATQNARKAAEQFAADSGSEVGKIKRAYQGTFSITDRDQAAASDGESGYDGCSSSPNKRVRIVTTVDYYLE